MNGQAVMSKRDAPSEPFDPSKLSGDWYNQLGSTMILKTDNNGGLTGKYNSAVGDAEDFYILTGWYDAFPPPGEGVSVGWVVTYRNNKRNAHSTSTWSGQYFGGDHERILTQWLLSSSTAPGSVWESTNIGLDTFTRHKLSAAPKVPARSTADNLANLERKLAKL